LNLTGSLPGHAHASLVNGIMKRCLTKYRSLILDSSHGRREISQFGFILKGKPLKKQTIKVAYK
jgi:hypothetical protein